MKGTFIGTVALGAVLSMNAGVQGGQTVVYEISFTNVTHGVILTPPIFSLSSHQINVFTLGEPASLGLQMVAEGGATNELRAELEAQGVQDVFQMMSPVPPGATISVELEGNKMSRLNLASMLLPTNDGFVAMNGARVSSKSGTRIFHLHSYDAGSEDNDELCANIPGPQCGGDGFNPAGGEGFVAPHPGIHGESELSRQSYNWGDPVAIVRVRVVDRHHNNDSDSDSDD